MNLAVDTPTPAPSPHPGSRHLAMPADADGDVPAAQAELHALLDMQLALPPEYRAQLSSHLPMALQALAALGADGARLRDFYRHYARRFEGRRAEAPPAHPAAHWQAGRGESGGFAPLQARFALELAKQGRDAVLRHRLPQLLPGVAGAAFHGAIRVAHAVQAGHAGELAAALAYWAWRWQDLPVPAAPGPRLALADWTGALRQQACGQRFDGGLIVTRMQAAARSPAYAALAGALAPAADLLPQLAGFAAGAYAETANFTVLHVVTGLHALDLLSPWWTLAADDLARLLGSRVAAAWLAAQVGEPRAPLPPASAGDWPRIVARAVASDDDHVIKLVQACRGWFARRADPRFLAAAARAVADS